MSGVLMIRGFAIIRSKSDQALFGGFSTNEGILGYAKWDNFLNVIGKSQKACENAGAAVSDHFADTGKMVQLGSGLQI